jgi:hypothetical protein
MFESFTESFDREEHAREIESPNPVRQSREEPAAETPAQRTTPDRSDSHTPVPADADKEAVLQQIEERARRYPERERSFRYHERLLDRVLSDNALEAYKKANYLLNTDSTLPFLLLNDLEAALSGLEEFKDRLPNRYKANVSKVLGRADRIKQIFQDYRLLREKGEGRGSHDVSVLLTTLDELRKIDPDRFPVDLIDVTDEERQRLQAEQKLIMRGSE